MLIPLLLGLVENGCILKQWWVEWWVEWVGVQLGVTVGGYSGGYMVKGPFPYP